MSVRLGIKLRDLRISKGLSQEALSFKSNVPQTTISDIELNKVNPNINHVIRLAKALNVSIEEMIKNT